MLNISNISKNYNYTRIKSIDMSDETTDDSEKGIADKLGGLLAWGLGGLFILIGIVGFAAGSVLAGVIGIVFGIAAFPLTRRKIGINPPGIDRTNRARRNVLIGTGYGLASFVGLLVSLSTASSDFGEDQTQNSVSGEDQTQSSSDESQTQSSGEGGNVAETETEEQSLVHEVGETFVVGSGAQSIEYVVNDASGIGDYIGSSPDLGATPDGLFLVINLTLTNVGDESLDITTNLLKLIDEEDREFEADTEAGIYAGQDSRISAEPISFDQLQPGLSVTRSVIFDVPNGIYRFAAEPAGAFSGAETHYVPIGEVQL